MVRWQRQPVVFGLVALIFLLCQPTPEIKRTVVFGFEGSAI